MKNLLTFLFLSITLLSHSQVSSYTFASSSGTYTPITGGANADNFTTWTNTVFFDDGVYTPQPIGFNFTYEGSVFTTFGISQNGFIILGAQPVGTNYTPISTSANSISPMGNDLIGRGSLRVSTTNANPTVTVTSGDISQILVGDKVSGTGIPGGATVLSKTATTITMSANATSTGTLRHFRFSRSTFGIRYLTSGTAPNRTCTVQFTGFQRYTTTGFFGELYNFQIKLNETTNTIQFVYNILGPGLGTGSATATTFQVGIRGATTFNNRTTTTNWASTTAGTLNTSTVTLSSTVKPTSGLTYTWTPPVVPPCTGTPTPGNTLSSSLTSAPNGTVNLSLQNNTIGTGVSYVWESSPDNSTWTSFGSTLATQTSSAITSATWFRCTVTCSGNSGTSTPVQITLAYCTYNITNNDPTGITSVIFGEISNTSVGGPAYTDFTSQSATLEQQGSYQLNVKVNTDGNWTVNTKVWIDWNQNYEFGSGEEYSLGSAINTADGITSLSPLTIIVPSDATLGETRMRIVSVEASDAAPLSCGTQLYGEAEDYKLSIIAPTGLPIELLTFTGEPYNDDVLLEWSTASEYNNNYFFIEKTYDGVKWEKIKEVNAAGFSTVKMDYITIDENPRNGLNYYRLTQVDFDGQNETFEIIAVNMIGTKDCDYKFYNMSGQLIDIQTVPPGIYFKRCGEISTKFVKY